MEPPKLIDITIKATAAINNKKVLIITRGLVLADVLVFFVVLMLSLYTPQLSAIPTEMLYYIYE